MWIGTLGSRVNSRIRSNPYLLYTVYDYEKGKCNINCMLYKCQEN